MSIYEIHLETEGKDIPTQYVICGSFAVAENAVENRIREKRWKCNIVSIQKLTDDEIMDLGT